MTFVLCASCAKKFSPSIKLKSDSVTSIDFKKTVFGEERQYKQKTVTEASDIKEICNWLTSLRLTKHDAIEIPVEKISYTIIINGTKQHRVLFMEEYIIFNNTAYTFNKPADKDTVIGKYNLLNYTETDTKLGLIS